MVKFLVLIIECSITTGSSELSYLWKWTSVCILFNSLQQKSFKRLVICQQSNYANDEELLWVLDLSTHKFINCYLPKCYLKLPSMWVLLCLVITKSSTSMVLLQHSSCTVWYFQVTLKHIIFLIFKEQMKLYLNCSKTEENIFLNRFINTIISKCRWLLPCTESCLAHPKQVE